jgi:hypothetical protein
VRTSQWSYETTGVVEADPDAVMRWWLHRDRTEWYLNRIKVAGSRHLRCEESVSDGIRTRTIQFMDRASWTHHTVGKATELTDGIPERLGDRFVHPYSAVRTKTSPLGGKLMATCECRIEFIPIAAGTEIVEVHSHTLSGMSKARRQRSGDAERVADERAFGETLDRCRLALGAPTNPNQLPLSES